MEEGKIRDTISVLDYYNPQHYEIMIENGFGIIREADYDCDVTDLWCENKYNLSSSYETKEFVIKVLTINLDYLLNGDDWKVRYGAFGRIKDQWDEDNSKFHILGKVKMKNEDVANELRNITWVFLKEYMKLENNSGINNPAECNGRTLEELKKFEELFDEYKGIIKRLYWRIEKLSDEDKNE